MPAIVSSGFDTERFYFIGFLPDKKSQKDEILQKLKSIDDCLIFYEAPHRLEKFFREIKEHFGNRKIVIAREISKIYETYYRFTIDEFLENPEMIVLKGEFVIIIEGAKPKNYEKPELQKMLKSFIKKGESKKNAVKKVQELTGEPKNRIYNLSLKLENN